MRLTHETSQVAIGLLDPRFNYIPANATDIVATWRRFGFDPRANQQRRERLRDSLMTQTPALIAA